MSMIGTVARKELREIVRDGRLRLLGALVVILALAALAFGVEQTSRSQHAREHAAERASKQWRGQGKKNPHVAAHYGTHVFAPTTVATAIDPGVSAYLGRAVKVEAHQRNLAAWSSAQDSGGLQRLGAFSVASVMLLLVPLLIIALGYSTWSSERERGTLRQLLSTAVDRRVLLWGKATALFAAVAGLLIPAALVIISALWWLGGGDATTLGRLGLLAVSYGVYFAVIGGLTLYASAAAATSRAALVAMIGVWGLFCLAGPRAAAEVAGVVAPLPSQAELARAVAHSLEHGVDGKTARKTAVEALTKDMMAEQGLADTGMLVAGAQIAGIELQAEARWEDTVFDHHMRRLDDLIARQEAWISWAGVLSPYVAMRSLSAGLCGTDFAHHRHFTEHTETWRKRLVQGLNEAFSRDGGAQGWSYQAGPELWKNAPPFDYREPGASFALQNHLVSVVSLLLWLLVAAALALRSARRVRVV